MEEEIEDFRSTRPSRKRSLAVFEPCPSPASSFQKRNTVNRAEVQAFVDLITTDPVLQAFFLTDRCNMSCDKYNLACVFVYFKRAGLSLKEYNRDMFFKALYLNLLVEDEKEDLRWELLPWCLGRNWRKHRKSFMGAKDELWQRMNFGAIVAMDACLAVIRLRTFKVLPQFQRERRKDHSRLKRAIGHVQYDPLGPLWHSKAGRQWILSRSDFEQMAMDEMYYCNVCETMEVDVLENNQDWTSSTAENARQLFFKAAMLLDPEWIEQNISDDLNQNVLKLHSGLDVSNDNISQLQEELTITTGRPIVQLQHFVEEEENNCPLMTSNDPNLGHVDNHGDVSNLIDLPHVKRAKFENDLDAKKICAILLNEH